MVAYKFKFSGKVDTHYARAVWFNKNDFIGTYDENVQLISKSGFYVPLDHRPLGVYFGMLIPNIENVIMWQENDAPYIPKEFESWNFEILAAN